MSADRKLMVAEVKTGGAAFAHSMPQPLFEMRLIPRFVQQEPVTLQNAWYPYAVADNGRRFLVATEVPAQTTEAALTVIVNWRATLKK